MKLKIILLFLYSFTLGAQNKQIEFNYRIGLSTNSVLMIEPDGFTSREYEKMSTTNDMGFIFSYKQKINNKYNIYLSTGIDLSQSHHFQRVILHKYDTPSSHIGNIVLKKMRWSLRLIGIHKQFYIWDNRLIINLGVEYVNRFCFSSITNYKSDFVKSSYAQNIEYSYDLTTYHSNITYPNNRTIPKRKRFLHLSPDFNLQLKFKITKQLYINTTLNYSINNYFYYDYKYVVKIKKSPTPSGQVPTHTENYHGYVDGTKYAVKDNFLYFNFGISYHFDKFK